MIETPTRRRLVPVSVPGHTRLRCAARCLSIVILTLCAAPAMPAEPALRTVLDGVYSSAQLTRGRTAYNRHCRKCHLNDLQGDALEPPLVSVLFLDAWREDYLSSLYEFIATRMPKGRDAKPGSLSEAEYVDIVAYIVAKNNFPAGTQELTRADLEAVLLVGPDGPQALPANATVRTVGCFTADAGGYALNLAAAPTRVRVADETDAAEIAKSALAPLGSRRFKLNNLDVLPGADLLQGLTSRKVQVKGVLNGEGDSARIFSLSLVPAGAGC